MHIVRPLGTALAVCLASVLSFSPAHAQYVTLEAAAGNSRFSWSGGSLPDSATALGLTGRYTWASGFGVEGGLRAHGEFVDADGAATARLDVTSYLVGVSFEQPVGPVILGASLGGHAWRLRGNVIGPGSVWLGRVEDSGTGMYYTLRAGYALSERLSLGLARSEYRLEDGTRIKSTDIRMGYRF